MKLVCYCLVSMSVTMSSGCSLLIMGAGVDPGKLTTEEAAIKKFGTPAEAGPVTGDPGCRYATFRTHRKIRDISPGAVMAACMTYGLFEIVMFPTSVWNTCDGFVSGQDLKFEFDKLGNTTGVYLNDKRIPIYFSKVTDSEKPPETIDINRPGPRIRPTQFVK